MYDTIGGFPKSYEQRFFFGLDTRLALNRVAGCQISRLTPGSRSQKHRAADVDIQNDK
jgi:hypothetical protein